MPLAARRKLHLVKMCGGHCWVTETLVANLSEALNSLTVGWLTWFSFGKVEQNINHHEIHDNFWRGDLWIGLVLQSVLIPSRSSSHPWVNKRPPLVSCFWIWDPIHNFDPYYCLYLFHQIEMQQDIDAYIFYSGSAVSAFGLAYTMRKFTTMALGSLRWATKPRMWNKAHR